MLLINFKTYKESSGENAITLANYAFELSREFSVPTSVCPNMLDLKDVARIYPGGTWAQHADYFERGRATGWVPLELIKEAGATGVILNHSEHKIEFENLKKTFERARQLDLQIAILAGNIDEAVMASSLTPDFVGYEPPELIASRDTSVAKAKPEVIEKIVKTIPNIPILVGAGIKNRQDVRVSLKLGAKGVIPASGITLASDQKAAIRELLMGWRSYD